MEPPEADNSNAVDRLIGLGAEIAGGIGGAAMGLLVAGPAGALLGGAASPALAHTLRLVAAESVKRALGRRERTRIGATLVFAAQKIQENLDTGRQIRQDEFFQEQPGKRSSAYEVAEGVLVAVQREHEESKLRYYGNLLGNLAFHPEFDRAQCNVLIRLAQQLSHRQLCLLVIFSNRQRFVLRGHPYRGRQGTQMSLVVASVFQEIMDLFLRQLIDSGGRVIPDVTYLNPATLKVRGIGAPLCDLMELWTVPASELESVAALLR